VDLKNSMELKKVLQNHRLIILVILVLVSLFSWYELRPSYVRKSCLKSALEVQLDNKLDYVNNYYRVCLVKKGLPPESVFVNIK